MNLPDDRQPESPRAPSLATLLRPKRRLLDRTPDGHLQVWLLYRPEPFVWASNDDVATHLWIRRAELYSSEERAKQGLERLIGLTVSWYQHSLFPELQIGRDPRGFRWLLCPAPIDALMDKP